MIEIRGCLHFLRQDVKGALPPPNVIIRIVHLQRIIGPIDRTDPWIKRVDVAEPCIIEKAYVAGAAGLDATIYGLNTRALGEINGAKVIGKVGDKRGSGECLHAPPMPRD